MGERLCSERWYFKCGLAKGNASPLPSIFVSLCSQCLTDSARVISLSRSPKESSSQKLEVVGWGSLCVLEEARDLDSELKICHSIAW